MKPIARERRIELAGVPTGYTFMRVPRRRHLHIVVDDDGQVQVRAPWRCTGREADTALHEHGSWVIARIERARERRRRRTPLRSGVELPLLDEALTLRVRLDAQMDLLPAPWPRAPLARARDDPVRAGKGRVQRRGRNLHVRLYTLRDDALRDLLKAWFRGQAERVLPGRLRALAVQLGVRPTRVTIRAQRTRWGSCSARGAISLNWRLLLLPSELADYVLVHELCHLRHLDHSPRFWNMVRGLMPDVDERRARIHEMQASLPL